MLNLKDLLTMLPPSCWAIFSGVVGRLKRGETYLLIRKWLLARWLRSTDEDLLNLKGLLTALVPGLKGSSKNEPVLRPLFRVESRQIPPFSSKNLQIRAENAGFSTPVLGVRVQSGGGCQAVNGGPRHINGRMVVVLAGTSG
ncbi:MAG: hypothetical protein ACLQOO_21520 [Terriglobia bacterium]